MHGIGGVEVLSRLKSLDSTRAIPVIIITAGGNAAAKLQCELTGAAVFLTKPPARPSCSPKSTGS